MTIKISDFIDKPVDIPENLLEYGLESRHNTFRAAKTLHFSYTKNGLLVKSLLVDDENYILRGKDYFEYEYANRKIVKNNMFALCPYSVVFEKAKDVLLTCGIPALKSMTYVYTYDSISFRSDEDRTYYLMSLDTE